MSRSIVPIYLLFPRWDHSSYRKIRCEIFERKFQKKKSKHSIKHVRKRTIFHKRTFILKKKIVHITKFDFSENSQHMPKNHSFSFFKSLFCYGMHYSLSQGLPKHSSFLRHCTSNDYALDFVTRDFQLHVQCIHNQTSSSLYQQKDNRINQKRYHSDHSCCRLTTTQETSLNFKHYRVSRRALPK